MSFLTFSVLFLGGHLSAALLFYFFHRVIFHGPLGKWPVLKKWAAIHTAHHGNPTDPGAFFFPWWANIAIWTLAGTLAYISAGFGLGMFSFFALYAYRHRQAHLDSTAKWAKHHQGHHFVTPRANFSGTYPFIDKLFGTAVFVPAEKLEKRLHRRKKAHSVE